MKKVVAGLALLFTLNFTHPVSASVSFPIISQINDRVYYNYIVRGNTFYYADDDGTKLYDLNTGTLLRTDDTENYLLDVSTDENWSVQKDLYGQVLSIHDRFGDKVVDLYRLSYNDVEYEFEYYLDAKFLPNTSTLVIASEDNLIFYDVVKEKVTFVRGIDTDGTLKVSSQYITIGNDSSIRVMDHKGQSVTEILPTERMISYDLTSSNELIYNTYSGRIYRYKTNLEESSLVPFKTSEVIDMDESGTFVGTRDGSLYDMETSKRIFTNLPQARIAFNQDTSKILVIDGTVRVYNTKNLSKRIINMKINPKLSSFIERNEVTPSVITTSKDKTSSTITSNVTWRTDNSQVVYFSKGKLIAKSPGKATIKATFEDFTATMSVTVKKDPRPSNTQWLKSQKKVLDQKGSFLNAPFKIYDAYSKVKGTNGKLYYNSELYVNGIFKDSWLYGTYRKKKTIDEIILPLSLEKRTDVTEKEVTSVFGKPKKVYKYEDGLTAKVIRGTKTLDQNKVKRINLYTIKKNHTLQVTYDDKGHARYMHLF